MSTATATPARPRAVEARSVTFPRVVAAEWIKFRSVRSTVWTVAVTIAAMVGVAVLVAWGSASFATGEDLDAGFGGNLVTLLSVGLSMAQLAVAVLGVLAVTSEYATGMARSTFTAVPTRLPVLGAKALVLSVVVAITAVVSLALAWVATLPFHDTLGVSLAFGDSGVQRQLVGVPLYLIGIALLGLAIGSLMRHTAGAITVVVALLLVVEGVISLVPLRAFELISPFLPSTAGSLVAMDAQTLQMIQTMQDGPVLTPWQGYGVMLAWVVALLAAAAVLLRHRDA